MNDDNITIWNITFDVDGKLYVLDEMKVGTNVHGIIKLMKDSTLIRNRKIINIFDAMNRELVFKKN